MWSVVGVSVFERCPMLFWVLAHFGFDYCLVHEKFYVAKVTLVENVRTKHVCHTVGSEVVDKKQFCGSATWTTAGTLITKLDKYWQTPSNMSLRGRLLRQMRGRELIASNCLTGLLNRDWNNWTTVTLWTQQSAGLLGRKNQRIFTQRHSTVLFNPLIKLPADLHFKPACGYVFTERAQSGLHVLSSSSLFDQFADVTGLNKWGALVEIWQM